MAEVKPFRVFRYGEEAGPRETLVAPPYDVISPQQREELRARSPYHVVHLTLPDDEAAAGRLWADWRRSGILADEGEPAYLWISQDYVGPDGVARTREGLVAALRIEPYESRVVLPHERTHRGPKEGRLRLLRETRSQLEPLFFLYEGPPPPQRPDREPDLSVDGASLWRLEPNGIAEAFADRQLLIADGHHRYETALAYHEEAGTPESAFVLAVVVSLDDPGLMIFPTHRVFEREPAERLPTEERLADRLGHEGISYTADWREAVRAVDAGEAEVAVLMRPTRIEDVFAVAQRGETMPQKSTYFYPKLVSGLMFLAMDPQRRLDR